MDSGRDDPKGFPLSCPIPISEYPEVLMAHGGGGKLTHQLIEKIFIPAFDNAPLEARHDGAVLEVDGKRLAFTTDSYVVSPLFFPGGDIGKLAVYGTVNDLAMCGARPLCLSAGLVLEEGLPMETLWKVIASMREAAATAGVSIVTGDTKVVDRGKGDGVFVNTSGVGIVEGEVAPDRVRAGDTVILSGDIGRHGMAILAAREGLAFESEIESDTAPLAEPALETVRTGEVHCLRDLTRGGLASALVEIATAAGVQIDLDERTIPVREDVRAACEILGLDPVYVANEGRFVAFLPEGAAEGAIRRMRSHAVSAEARAIGRVVEGTAGLVTMRTGLGTRRVVEMLSGDQLPRIC